MWFVDTYLSSTILYLYLQSHIHASAFLFTHLIYHLSLLSFYLLSTSLSVIPPLPAAIARFCEAILEFLADEHRAAEAKIRAADFEGQIYSAYEQLFNVWLQSKEASKESRVSTDIHALFPSVTSLSPPPLLPSPSSSPSLVPASLTEASFGCGRGNWFLCPPVCGRRSRPAATQAHLRCCAALQETP